MGRTARGTGGKGKALLFLMPEELGFLRYLKDSKVPLGYFFVQFCLNHNLLCSPRGMPTGA